MDVLPLSVWLARRCLFASRNPWKIGPLFYLESGL